MKAAEITPTAQKIDKLIKRIDEGDIKIPAFQRGYVWKQEQVIDLLQSIYSEYPIGSVLLWKTEEILNSTRNLAGYKIPDRDAAYPVNYALDGQQRLSSIYGVFSSLVEQEDDPAGYNPNADIFEIYFDFENRLFVEKDNVINTDSAIHLRKLLDVTCLMSVFGELKEEYHKPAQELASQFLNYEVPVVTIENRDRSDVGIIFERINNTGTKLSALDLMTAWTWTDDFHLLEASNSLLEELEGKGFGSIKHKTLLQIISAVIQSTTVSKNILNLTGEQVRDNWDRICNAIRKTVDFLATDIGCKNTDFLPFTQQLIPLIKFHDLIARPSSAQLDALREYFWKTSFSNRYSTGQTNAKMDSDIEKIGEVAKGDVKAFAEYKYTLTGNILKNTKFSKANPVTRAFLLLMAQGSPVDMIRNQKIDIDKALAQYNRKEYHHVFPQAFLKGRGVDHDGIFCVLNFCFLSSDSNKAISKKAPSDYIFTLVPDAEFNEILSSNLLPLNKDIYRADDYEKFKERRAGEVLAILDKLAG